MKKSILNFLLTVFLASKVFSNAPDLILDRFIVGELYCNKNVSWQYIQDIPVYKKVLTPYIQDYSWGYYIKFDKNRKMPAAGIVFIF